LESTILRLGTPLLWLRLIPPSLRLHQAPSGSFIPSAPPQSLSLWLHRGLPDPHLHIGRRHHLPTYDLRIFPIAQAHRLSVSTSGSSTICSAAIGRPLKSADISPPWLLPPSAPPWVDIMAVAWVQLGSSCSNLSAAPPCRFITNMYQLTLSHSCSDPQQQPPPLGQVLNSTAIDLTWRAPDSPNSNELIYTLLRNSEIIHISHSQHPFG
ncbi:hypothetical protein cypCar_00002774, partial [Cyprinus carpio]